MKKHTFSFFSIEKITNFVQKYRKVLLLMVICGLLTSMTDVFIPLFQRYSLNHYVETKTLDTLPLFIVLYVLMLGFTWINNYISCSNAMMVEVSLNRDIRNAVFDHLQKLSFSYYNQNSVGYIHARLMSDASKIGSLISWTTMDAVWHLTYLVGAIVVMFVMNAKLAALVVLVLPVLGVLFSVFEKKLTTVNREVREINSHITGNFNEGIIGAQTIKTLVVEERMDHHFREETTKMRRKSVRVAHLHGVFGATMGFASSLALAIVLWRGGVIAQNEIGTFSMFMTYAQGMMEPVRWVVSAISNLITTKVNIDRIDTLLHTVPDVKDTDEVIEKYGDSFHPKKENWEEIHGDIDFCDVSFKYPDGDEYVLNHFNLHIPQGSNIAVVGETGAGKSTLVNLVCRFFEPTEGQVLIDGKDARERSQLWLHSSIGYVLQSPHLFSGSIRENLLYGNANATEDEMWEALDLVSASEVVERLEKGLDTDVGEGGNLLSTGEKQLISFARAILAKPKILIFDEATASVDTMTEQRIQKAIGQVIRGRTSIMIAHRLSTVRNADLILVVKDGRIVERGVHEELLQQKGYYYRLYTRQYEDEATGVALS